EANQIRFYQQLASTPVQFIWGEAYDQFWKTGEGPQGPHWGFHGSTGQPKAILAALANIYTRSYVPQPGSFQFSASDYRVAENAGTIAITVTRIGGSDG